MLMGLGKGTNFFMTGQIKFREFESGTLEHPPDRLKSNYSLMKSFIYNS